MIPVIFRTLAVALCLIGDPIDRLFSFAAQTFIVGVAGQCSQSPISAIGAAVAMLPFGADIFNTQPYFWNLLGNIAGGLGTIASIPFVGPAITTPCVTRQLQKGFSIDRQNVKDMMVEPDGSGTGSSYTSPFIQELNSPLPGTSTVNAVPVINIWGDVNHEQEPYSIASPGLGITPNTEPSKRNLFCRSLPLKPQFSPTAVQPNTGPDDSFIPKVMYEVIKPLYIAQSLYNGARAIVDAFLGNWMAAALRAYGSAMWIRGWSYIDVGAQTAYRRIIGAYKLEEREFGFRIFGTFIGFKWKVEVPLPSDAFIPEWSQKSPQAVDNFRAERANHLMQANHPSVTAQFERAFNSTNPAFFVRPK